MATFGKELISQLTNPAYAKGLFTAAEQLGSLPGRQRMQEKLATANPVERFDIAIAKLTREGKLEDAANLEVKRADFLTKQQLAQDKLITDAVAGQMVSAGSTEVPSDVVISGKTVSIPPRLQSEILEATNTLQSRRDGRETAMTEGKLTEYYIDTLNKYPDLQDNSRLMDSVKQLNDPDSGLLPSQRKRLAKNIMSAVDAYTDRQFDLLTGEKSAKIRVGNLIDDIQKAGSNMWFWQDDDMADALEGMSDSERNTFIDQAALYYQINPSATAQELIDVGMAGMRNLIPGQEQSEAITAAEREEAAENEAIIKTYIETEGISREEAIDRLKKGKLSAALFKAGGAIATQGNISITGGN